MAHANAPQVVRSRVGVDSGVGGIQGPLLPNHAFDYIPIPDTWNHDNKVTCGSTDGHHGRNLFEYWPGKRKEQYRHKAIHFDPEFKTFTDGDPTRPKQSLKRLEEDDLLVFYAGLQPWSVKEGFHGDPHLYIIGYFIVSKAGHANDLIERYSRKEIEEAFAKNMHMEKHARLPENLVLVKGKRGSKLLDKASLLSEYGENKDGERLMILRHGLQKYFADFSKLNSIQRSPPRWVSSEFAKKAKGYVLHLK